jgi:hypothetical protein
VIKRYTLSSGNSSGNSSETRLRIRVRDMRAADGIFDALISLLGAGFVLNRRFTKSSHLTKTTSKPWRISVIRSLTSAVCIAAFATIAGIVSAPAHASDDGIKLVMNQAKVVKLARPADTIVIGNPLIADASVQDSNTVVLTGKGFGVTNLVILDADGAPIVDEEIFVTRGDAKSVRVFRRTDIQTLSCTPNCESAYKSDAERTSESELKAN